MTEVFLKLLNMSIAAGWLALAVILLRMLLKKAPKWIVCFLWGLVALRLMIPITAESKFSLIPSAEVIPQDIVRMESPAISSAIPAINSAVNPLLAETLTTEGNYLEKGISIASVVWVTGMAVLLSYSLITYLKIRHQVRNALRREKNIYVCDDIDSPFILGTVAPKIYIPSGIADAHLVHVLAHENAHIKRGDHWWKPLGFLLLAVYWFNPLLWVVYILLCRDIEMACDEKVVAETDSDGKRGYSEALVACSVHRRMIMICPVAFGEVSLKSRIKGVLHYKKPAFWVVIVSVVACVITAVCFLTNPEPCAHTYQSAVAREATCTSQGAMEYTCSQCRHMYTANIAMREHSFDQPVVTLAPTCTQQGNAQQTCTDCGLVKTVPLAVAPHTAGEPFFVKEPNCTEPGEKSATCADCAAVFQVEVLAANGVHNLKETVLRDSTCTDTGEGILTCTLCNHTESCTIERLPHSYQVAQITEATCMWDGTILRICTYCDDPRWEITSKRVNCSFEPVSGGKKCIYCGFFVPKTSANWQDTASNSVIDYAFWTFDMEKGQWRAQ